VGAAVVAIGLLGAPSAVAGPRPGERYDGRSATGQRIYLSVRPNGSHLHRYEFNVRTRCSDGKRRLQGLIQRGEGPTPIDAAGRFAYRSVVDRGGYGRVRGRLRLSFSGVFDAAGDAATGTIRATFRARRFDWLERPGRVHGPPRRDRRGAVARPGHGHRDLRRARTMGEGSTPDAGSRA
jgi:hypothetical protein